MTRDSFAQSYHVPTASNSHIGWAVSIMPGSAPSTPGSRPIPPKDLISLRNARTGEVFKFACRTCIDGHRAPLCDPNKHRNRILFRRPNPGRPARQCGHARSASCDCLSKRTLCTTLTDPEWDLVNAGMVISVVMYDSVEELNAATDAIQTMDATFPTPPQQFYTPVAPMQTSLPIHHGMRTYFGQSPAGVDLSASHANWQEYMPAPPTTQSAPGQHMPVSALHDGQNDQIHTFQAMASIGQYVPVQHPLITANGNRQDDRIHTFQASPQSPGDLTRDVQFGQFQVDVHARQEYIPASHSTPSTMTGSSSAMHTPMDPMGNDITSLQSQISMHDEFSQLSPAMQEAYLRNSSAYTSMDQMDYTPATSVASGHTGYVLDADSLSSPMPKTSQSCCSKKSVKQEAPQTFGTFNYPAATPSQQFPCAKCASTLCTCTDCPSTMQSLETRGAWAQACERTGHSENPFPPGYTGRAPQDFQGEIHDDSENLFPTV